MAINDELGVSNFDPYKNPDQEGERKRLLEDIYGGLLNAAIKRSFRIQVLQKLKAVHGLDMAIQLVDGVSQNIINTSLLTHHPKLFSRAISEDVSEKIKLEYPEQVNQVNTIMKMIADGKNKKDIVYRLEGFRTVIN